MIGNIEILVNQALSNLSNVAINESLIPDTNDIYDFGNNSLRWKDGYFGGVLTCYDLIVESGSSIHLAGATFENKGHYTSVDTNWIVEHDDQDTAFIGVYANSEGILTHANLVLEAQGSALNLIKNSPLHSWSPNAGGIINEGSYGTFVDHDSEISWLHFTSLVKDEYGNITNLTGIQSLMRLTDNYLKLEDVDLQVDKIQSEYELYINANSPGNIRFFDGIDIVDNTDGKRIYVYRRASEGDSYLNFYGHRDQEMHIDSNVNIVFTNGIYNYMTLQESDHKLNVHYGLMVNGVDVLTSYTESDPIFSVSPASGILAQDILNWNEAYGWGEHSDYLVNNANDVTTGRLTAAGFTSTGNIITPILESASGVLKLQSNANGDVTLFSSSDVDDTEDGKELKIWRNAPEGNNYIRTYIASNQNAMIHSNTSILLQNASGKNMQFNSGQHIYLNLGDTAGNDKVRIRDTAGLEVGIIDSNGNTWFRGDLSIGINSDVLIQANGDSYFNGGKVGIGITPSEDFHIEKSVDGFLTSKLYNSNTNGIAQHIIGANGGGHINLIANSGPGDHLGIPMDKCGIAVDWNNIFVISIGHSGNANEMMRFDAGTGIAKITGDFNVTGDIGIGGFVANSRLSIVGSESGGHTNAAGLAMSNIADGGDTWYLRTGATGTFTPAGGFSIADTSAYRFVIDENGNVGIGTTTPGLSLEVRNADDNLAIFFDSRAQAQGVGGGIAFGGKYNNAGGEAMSGRIGTKKTNGTSGDVGFDMVFETQDSEGSITERMIFKSDGKCGIGDIVPTMELDVNGAARIRGEFYVDADIEVSGNIGIGKTSPNHRIDAYINRISGIVRSARFQTDGNHVDARGLYVIAGEDTESGTNYWFEARDGNNGLTTGGLRSVAGVFDVYNTSDKRMKKKIKNTKIIALDIINKLKVRDFEWRKKSGHIVTGFIAQEVKEVYPDAVGDPDPENGMYGISKTSFIPIIIKYIQELEKRIIKLEKVA